MHGLVQIAPLPPVPLHDLFTYRVPEPLRPLVRPGMRVRMPLGRQTRTGVVAGFVDVAPPGELRPILDVLDADPFVPPDLLELCRWTAGYYLASLAEVLAAVVPVALPAPGRERVVRLLRRLTPEEEAALARRAPARARAYRVLCAAPGGELGGQAARAGGLDAPAVRALVAAGLAEAGLRPRRRPPGAETAAPRPALAPAQRSALDAIAAAIASRDAASFLLHGVTGSGKTEVLLAAAEHPQAARDGRHVLLELPDRPTAHPLPPIELVRLRGRPPGLLTDELSAALAANLARGEQTLVFLNRRGFAAYLQCPACGVAATCPHCSVTLTWHRAARALVCHHCHHRRRPPPACPACGGPPLAAFGVGTEQIEAALRAVHPLAAVERLDRDAAQRPGAQRRILGSWRSGDTDILVGTQMVSKGHDVPGVTLVAVLLADLSLNVPDFRAAERTFQLLVQVAGRAGRGDAPGRVIVQTFRPEHPSVAAAATHDYAGFMARELERRRALGYPPFARLVNLRLEGRDGASVERAARELAARLRRQAPSLRLADDAVLGPAVARLIEDMTETMYAAPGVGLAATQVGVSQRVIVLDVHDEDEAPGKRLLKLINPEIVEREGTIVWEEGCLSVPDLTAPVTRARRVLVRAWTPEEQEVEVEGEELLAVALQHEIDHLEGKLFLDRLSRLKRDLYRARRRKLERQGRKGATGARPVLI